MSTMGARRGQGRGAGQGRGDGHSRPNSSSANSNNDSPAFRSRRNSRGAEHGGGCSGGPPARRRGSPPAAAASSSNRAGPLPGATGAPSSGGSVGSATPPYRGRGRGVPQSGAVGTGAAPTSVGASNPRSWPRQHSHSNCASVCGAGSQAVLVEPDKEAGVWKVSPPPGKRFSLGFLQGVSNFVAARLQAQQAAQQDSLPAGACTPPPPPPPSPPEVHIDWIARGGLGPLRAGGLERRDVAEAPCHKAGLKAPIPHLEGSACPELDEAVPVTLEGAEADLGTPGPSTHPGVLVATGGVSVVGEDSGFGGSLQETSRERDAGEWEGDGCCQGGGPWLAKEVGGAEERGSATGAAGSGSESSDKAATGDSRDPEESAVPRPPLAAAVEGGGQTPSRHSVEPSSSSRPWWRHDPMGVAALEGGPVPGSKATPAGGGRGRGVDSRDWSSRGSLIGGPGRGRAGGRRGSLESGGGAGGSNSAAGAIQLSLRLEQMGLTDMEAGLLADWWEEQGAVWGGRAGLRKLWLFDNELGDEGVKHIARLVHPGLAEAHLSHNRMGVEGAAALLRAVHAGASPPAKPLWLCIEWNRVPLEGFLQLLEREYEERGLLVDLPQPAREDAAPSLPSLPCYLTPRPPPFSASPRTPTPAPACSSTSAAAAEGGAKGVSGSGSREGRRGGPTDGRSGRGGRGEGGSWVEGGGGGRGGRQNGLRFLAGKCHVRLPWLSCQYQLPAEAAVLRAVRNTWKGAGAVRVAGTGVAGVALREGLGGMGGVGVGGAAPAVVATPPGGQHAQQDGGAQRGPLLLFPDTSALLSMLGAHASVARRSALTLTALGELAQQGRFGRGVEEAEQVFVVVTDSVAKQLDGLKQDPAARAAVRFFMGQGLDAWGPAGLDFLTVLGGHEGEGLVREHSAQVAGSGSRDVGSSGQKMDHKIVEVALFFQREISLASGGGTVAVQPRQGSSTAGESLPAFPVLLLSGDNAQIQLSKSHGLPAVRMADLAPLEQWVQQAQQAKRAGASKTSASQPCLTATLVRELVGRAAVIGLGTVALRSIHQEFDGAVACLREASEALHASLSQLAAVHAVVHDDTLAPAAALSALRAVLPAACARTGFGDAASSRNSCSDGTMELSRSELGCKAIGNVGDEKAVSGGLLGGHGEARKLVETVQEKLREWEELVQTQQSPSRVLKWASAK